MRASKANGGSVTLEKLARLAKVSVSTVSRALNDHPSISNSTKKELWALARKTRLRISPPHAGEPHRRRGRDHRGDAAGARQAVAAVTSVLPRVAGQHWRSRARSRL
jgi:transcriptional regulator with XRE-family HTH domain